jgi:hypothetical protein
MYENIDNELLDRLRPLELKNIDLNLIHVPLENCASIL